MDVDIGDINKLKNVVTEQFKDGLPVLRAKARVSQEVIAEKIGVSRQTYNAIETGKRDIPWTTFLARHAFFNNNQICQSRISFHGKKEWSKDMKIKPKYAELDSKMNIVEIQDKVLRFWNQNHIFEKSVEEKKGGEIVFYDGPPFPTGKPHHGTVLVSFIKDMIARYWTMRGFSVPRVWGWDCHGLPIEHQVETLMGIKDKNEIERSIGIDKFNEKCFEIVSSNNNAWIDYVNQMARWVDYDGAYKTMNKPFMESVMWAFKQCYEKGYIYRDYRVTPYCMHCETSLSISDTRESDSTRLRQDRWIIAKFKLDHAPEINGKPTYMLAWTTTPWTLPSNLCLAVGKDLDYSFVDVGEEIFIACTNILSNVNFLKN